MLKRIVAIITALMLLLSCASVMAEETVEEPIESVPDERVETVEMTPWDCPSCGFAGNTGNFCTECGAAKPWDCPDCGMTGNTGKFCPNCGAAKPIEQPGIKAGDIITFGKYEQDNDKGNGTEPIEWIILEVKGSKALVLSRYGLVKGAYANSSNGQTWSSSKLRSILNDDFYNEAFNEDEKAAILATEVDEGMDQQDPNHPAAKGRVGKNTTDHVFILSYAETLKYQPTKEERMCYVTEYIKKNSNYSDRRYDEGFTCWYWLRNPAYKNNASVVDWDGTFETCYLHHPYGVARPCCWVDLAALGLIESDASPVDDSQESKETPSLVLLGTVKFGRYNQDNEPGPEPIEWTVIEIDEENGRVWLLSKYILDYKMFNVDYNDMGWEDSTLRVWLNETFLNTAFNSAERSAILLTDVDNSPEQSNPNYKIGSFDTQDKIYLLSYAEAKRYVGSGQQARCPATDYAIHNGLRANEKMAGADGKPTGEWWLRSLARSHNLVDYISTSGDYWDRIVNETGYGVRPCCWVDSEALLAILEAEAAASDEDGEENSAVAEGDTVTFGHYEQDNDADNGAEPIEWQVLLIDEEAGSALLIALDALDCQPYHTKGGQVDWADSTIRAWLNDAFLNTAFTPEEQERILLTEVDNSKAQTNQKYTKGSDNTLDKVFLLSYAEVLRFTATYLVTQCCPTQYANARGAFVYRDKYEVNGRNACQWWLRTPGQDRRFAAYVHHSGELMDFGQSITQSNFGVRPCCWVKIDALEKTLQQEETEP